MICKLVPGVSIKMFGREYDLGFGRNPPGTSWMMLVNRETGAVLPLTAIDGPASSHRDVQVLDMGGFLPELKRAGIVEQTGAGKVWMGIKLVPCQIIHDGLAAALEKMELRHEQTQSRECEGHGR
jgi:hypothetical protein